MISMCWLAGLVLIGVREQGQEARTPDGELQLALIVSARTRDAARNDLAGLSDIALERRQILVVDLLDVVGRESAELLAAKKTCHMASCLPCTHGHVVVIAIVAKVVVAARVLIRSARHRRRFGDGFVHFHHQAAQHRVAEAERSGQFGERLLIAFDVEENVVRFVHLGDGEGQLAPAPILETMHRSAAGTDHALVAIDHRRNLLALVRMDQEHDFIMPHCKAPFGLSLPLRAVRQGVRPVSRRKRARRILVWGSAGQPARCRRASNRATPAATDTLRDCTRPAMGMRTRKSQRSRVRRRMPLPSAPSTSASGRFRSAAYRVCGASPSVPTTQMPRSLSISRARARLVTLATGTNSAAPAATLRTTPSTEAARSLGISTACAPAASAVRRQAPRLCGSVTPSRISSRGSSAT